MLYFLRRLERKKEVLDACHDAVGKADPPKAKEAEPKKAKGAAEKKAAEFYYFLYSSPSSALHSKSGAWTGEKIDTPFVSMRKGIGYLFVTM